MNDIKMTKRAASSKTIHCETCAMFKMHRIVQKETTGRITTSYQVLHFDLTILEKNSIVDETSCIAHFTDKFKFFNVEIESKESEISS
jgi:hypothetical protein